MIKFWIISLPAMLLVYWLFARVPRSIMPQMQVGGTEQIMVAWRDSLGAYKKDYGTFPEAMEDRTYEQAMVERLAGENPEKKQYLNPALVRINHTVPVDGWDNYLQFDPLQNGDRSHLRSSGPDGVFGTPDDIDSVNLRQRNLPAPEDPSEDRPKFKSKTKTTAKNPAAEPASEPASEPEPEP
jgi:hypothetical protein